MIALAKDLGFALEPTGADAEVLRAALPLASAGSGAVSSKAT